MSRGKFILGVIVLIFASLFLMNSCERIDAGHVGVKVDMYGSGKGVNDVTECTGVVFYNPITTKIYEFPTFIQHKEYKDENSFVVNSKDGSEFSVSPIMNYSVQREKVPAIFAKYRRSLEEIEEGFLKTAVYDAFRLATNKLSLIHISEPTRQAVYLLVANRNASYTAVFKNPSSISSKLLLYLAKIAGTFSL